MKTSSASLLIAVALLRFDLAAAVEPKTKKTATATCHVCRHNRDLACVEFRLKPTTPRLVHAGTRYCFCSEDCRKAFVKQPEKYIPKRK